MINFSFIKRENIGDYARTNLSELAGDPKAIVVDFRGLGDTHPLNVPLSEDELDDARNGIIRLTPYADPWGWMNTTEIKLTDALVKGLRDAYPSLKDAPIVSSGLSMGGMCALIYTLYAEITPSACAALYPVCDVPFHYTERPDLPRTFVAAYAMEPQPLAETLRLHSPIHMVDNMPRVPYQIVHGFSDDQVGKAWHSDVFVKAMREAGHNVEYVEVDGMGHEPIVNFPEANKAYRGFIRRHALGC